MCNKLRLVVALLGFLIGLSSQAAYSQNLNLGPQKTAVIAVKFDAAPDPLTPDGIRKYIFDSGVVPDTSLNAYISEVSYGQTSLVGSVKPVLGDVFGWYTLPPTSCDFVAENDTVLPASPSPTNFWGTPILKAAIAAVEADGIDLRDYRRIILFQPPGTCFPMGTVGTFTVKIANDTSTINASVLWTSGWHVYDYKTVFSKMLQHEVGHNFGLDHAQSYNCGAQTFATSGCTGDAYDITYSDPFDKMISVGYSAHYNAYYKEKIGWLNSTNDIRNVTQSGTFTILPLESTSAGYKAIKIPRPNNPTQEAFYIEYRQRIGYDDAFDTYLPGHNAYNGALIHYAPSLQERIARSLLLDATPDSMASDPSMDLRDAALVPGQTFEGPGFTVRTKTATSSGLTVNVCTDPVSVVTTDGSDGSASVNATLKLEFSGKITSLSVGSKATTLKVCQGNLLNYKAITTVGTAVCTIDNRAAPSQGIMSVESLRKLNCANTQSGGSDKDSFSILPI